MFEWFSRRSARRSKLSRWSIAVEHGAIVVRDQRGYRRQVALRELDRVVLITADHWFRRTNVVMLLYAHDPDPVALVPVAAHGFEQFIDWLRHQKGFDLTQLERAQREQRVNRFVIYAGSRGSGPALENKLKTLISDRQHAPVPILPVQRNDELHDREQGLGKPIATATPAQGKTSSSQMPPSRQIPVK